MRRAALLLALFPLTSAQAVTVAPALSLETQARRADLIVRGSLGTPQTVTEGEISWRVYPLTLTETVAGDTTRLRTHANEPALYVWAEAADLPAWRTGQDAFFLLYTARLDSPMVGYNQGYYPVVGGSVTLPVGEKVAVPQPPAPQPPAPQVALATASAAAAEPVPANPSPDAPPVSAPSSGSTAVLGEVQGLPNAAVIPAPASTSAASPEPQTAPAAGAQQVTADEFRAIVLQARSAGFSRTTRTTPPVQAAGGQP